MAYNPNSVDAMFGVVVTRLDEQDKTLEEILQQVQKTNARVTSLEQSREVGRAQVAIIAGIVSMAIGGTGWLVTIALTVFNK